MHDYEVEVRTQIVNSGMEEEDAELEEEEKLVIINRLHQVLRPFLLRRVKSEVATQLPEKQEYVLRCQLSVWQKRVYNLIQVRDATRI